MPRRLEALTTPRTAMPMELPTTPRIPSAERSHHETMTNNPPTTARAQYGRSRTGAKLPFQTPPMTVRHLTHAIHLRLRRRPCPQRWVSRRPSRDHRPAETYTD
jgi:hypothetical protein